MNLSFKEKKRLFTRFGSWAVVTGASSGIGFELAKQLTDSGFNLIIAARNEEKLLQTKKLLNNYNTEIEIVVADLSQSAGIEKLISVAHDLNVGLLINNAGYGTSGQFTDSSLHSEINMLRLNCESVLHLTHYFAQKFKRQQRGGIIFLSSLVAFQGVPFAANYSATKAYIQSFAEAISVELKPFQVSVLAAAPGPVLSGFGSRANMKMSKGMKPEQLGVPILTALGKNNTVVPGLLSKILVYSLRTVPRFMKVKIMQMVMSGFTKHQRK